MEKIKRNSGISIIEIIMTIAILGIVFVPLMSIFIVCQKINREAAIEYETLLIAQSYMEEIKGSDNIYSDEFEYNNDENCYERLIVRDDGVIAKIIITTDNIIHNILVEIWKDEKMINSLSGSKI